MTIATLTWPAAVVVATSVAAGGLVLAILIWSIFRTGQTAIKEDSGHRKDVERLDREVDELRAELERRAPAT
jgi:hypothetical protein